MTKTKHDCNKEVEIAEIHQDIKYIRKALEGNGKEGLVDEVKENSNYRVGSKAKASLIKFMVGAEWATTLIVLAINVL